MTDGEEAMVVRVVKVVLAYFILMGACVSDCAKVCVSDRGGAGERFFAKEESFIMLWQDQRSAVHREIV